MLGGVLLWDRQKLAEDEESDSLPPMPANTDATPLLARTVPGVVLAGIELGLYNFFGTSLQASLVATSNADGFKRQKSYELMLQCPTSFKAIQGFEKDEDACCITRASHHRCTRFRW